MDGAAPPVGTTSQSVAALPEVGSLADADGGLDNRDGYPTKFGSLANAVVVRVELRPDASPSVAAEDVSASEQIVAALPPVGNLAGVGGADQDVSAGAPSMVELVGSGEEADEGEQKLLADAVAAAAATERGADQAEQSAASSARGRRLRRERRAIEQTLHICRDG
jgi:hypothetical protein